MRKDEALNVLTTVYNQITKQIQAQDNEIEERELINFLHDTAKALFVSKFHSPIDFNTQGQSFEDEYKLLAKQSLNSYSTSNENIRQISNDARLLDTEALNEKFQEIQEHLDTEVQTANETISTLMQRVKHLETKSNIDPLTKTYNRRAMDHYFEGILDPSHELNNFAIMMIDIDNFKVVNDTHGHIAGDKVLIFLGRLLKRTIREGDKVFRFGGEEFLITLNRINPEVCHKISDRILRLIRENTLLFKNAQLSVTLSIGATMYKKGDTQESIIERADKALYRAKTTGKDKIEVEL